MTTPTLLSHNLGHGATAFTTTRRGGVSSGAYGEFNINAFSGDSREAIEANRRLLAAKIGIDEGHILVPHQVHGTELRYIAPEFFGLSAATQAMLLDGVDGLLTDTPRVCIGVSTADCIPIVLWDARRRLAAAVHAGWRGTAQCIARKAVEAMERLGSRPADIAAAIGPGISADCFEVGDEVYEAFADAGFDMDDIATRRPTADHRSTKWHIDLTQANANELQQAGLSAANIARSGLCTYANPDTLFSARRLGAASGRLYTGIFIE